METTCKDCNQLIDECTCLEDTIDFPKQETLEEAAEKEYPTIHEQYQYDAFIEGAKWQQERSYSEEEVLDLLFDFQIHRNDLENCVEAREWFEQLKNKIRL